MSNELVKTQSEIAQRMISSLRERINPPTKGGNNIVLLDVSESMSTFTDSNMRRIDSLKHALRAISGNNVRFKLFAFNDNIREASVENDFIPGGGTKLAEALIVIRDNSPSNLTIITDGEPNNAEAALMEAARINCPINVVFVGSAENSFAIEFCRQLANANNGQFASNPLEAATLALLPKTLNLMLTDGRPGPIAL